MTRPFWFNEQWRAYFISKPGNWLGASSTFGAPFPAGWFLLERVSSFVFGSTELTLRLPTAAFLPITSLFLFLLGKSWMPVPAALVAALVASSTGILLSFAVQLAPYQVDAAAVVAILLLQDLAWGAHQTSRWHWRLYLAYIGIAVACTFSTPAVFVAASVLTLDLVRSARRSNWSYAAAAAISGVLILAHLVLYVLPQNALTKSSYWVPQFMPHHGLTRQISFVWDGLTGFITGAFTGASIRPPGWSWTLTTCFTVLIIAGIVELSRSKEGRTILAALGGSLLLMLVGSYVQYWPFGFVRTNYYLVPLLIFVAGTGAVRVSTYSLLLLRRSRGRHARRRVPLIPRWLGVAPVLFVVTGLGLATAYEVSSFQQLHRSLSGVAYGEGIGRAVAVTEAHASSGTSVVVAGDMAISGWEYYEDEYTGALTRGASRIASNRVVYVVEHGSSRITQMIGAARPSEVYLYVPDGTTGSEVGLDIQAIRRARRCSPVAQQMYTLSGLLVTLNCR